MKLDRTRLVKMVSVILIANSIVSDLQMDGVIRFALPGGKLRNIARVLSLNADYKIVVSGIQDVMASNSSTVVAGREVIQEFERVLRKASNFPRIIPCSFYPPRNVIPEQL